MRFKCQGKTFQIIWTIYTYLNQYFCFLCFLWFRLSMDIWGGQSLDESGRKMRTWSWTDHDQTPTVLRPIFMSLNRNIGVRVLGQQLVFVSFLALGQQARFRVGKVRECRSSTLIWFTSCTALASQSHKLIVVSSCRTPNISHFLDHSCAKKS